MQNFLNRCNKKKLFHYLLLLLLLFICFFKSPSLFSWRGEELESSSRYIVQFWYLHKAGFEEYPLTADVFYRHNISILAIVFPHSHPSLNSVYQTLQKISANAKSVSEVNIWTHILRESVSILCKIFSFQRKVGWGLKVIFLLSKKRGWKGWRFSLFSVQNRSAHFGSFILDMF